MKTQKIGTLFIALFALFTSGPSLAAGGAAHLEPSGINVNDVASLQRGAKMFVNYCLSCHEASYMRYKRLSEDLQMSEEMVMDNLVFSDAKIGELMTIAMDPEDGAEPDTLVRNADTAMYHAKNAGGNKYQFFSDSMNKQAVKRLQIENLIRFGLKEDFFSVFYQPKIDIATGKVAGMEALVRFETPTKGIISPVVFIPVSEETGQIIDIGEVVLRKACIATKKWVDAGLFDGRMAVNLSAVQFAQPNLVSLIAQILLKSGLPAKHLELEIRV